MGKILIVDDDSSIAGLISDVLEDEGFETVVRTDGRGAYDYIMQNTKDISLIMLDIMMPEFSGLEVCRFVRNHIDCPIIIVSAKGKTVDMVEGFENGADDYISKPFVIEELVARVKANFRREQRRLGNTDSDIIKVGDIEISVASLEVFKAGKPVAFSTREFQLLQYLMENAGKVLTREQIFAHVWDTEFGDIGTVAVNIKSIRDKIDPDNEYIKTIWGVGYKLVKSVK